MMKLLPLGLILLIGFSCAKNDGAGSHPTPMPTAQTAPPPPPSCFTIEDGSRGRTLTAYSNAGHCPKSIAIPRDLGVKVIGPGAFKNKALELVLIPSTVTRIEDDAFADNLLKTIKFPDSVLHIGKKAFSNNRLGAWMRIPINVNYIGDHAFSFNNFLRSVCIEEKKGKTAFHDGAIRIIKDNAFPQNGKVSVNYHESCR